MVYQVVSTADGPVHAAGGFCIHAKEIAALDHFSGGRFLFGIGAGWLKEETEIMGGDFAHRWTQTQEAILAMQALWTQEEAEYHGKYYDFPRPLVPEAGPEAASAHHPGFVLPDPAALRAFEDAGVDAALIALETAGEQEALAKLEELAQTVLPSPGRGV
jgi:alkanesulfonate monooxygenase SsuD/methylene tetrahydromethanopterin reductase-like flavin-dependent oxidoreductase (luciferase family)